ncbi:helix-turn-helix domain-containing protein [Plantactinospora mayteni]|uniref:Transcriptional regulator n=1 Tax=Plantactinospora mayteni TaxID=566021 RepID=A0ABQ4EZX0_9ACTN|nr:helix-turn-helix domain-containing protein [Plantactinospora mayteni]GIH00200.1 transcriptional regulator [Plantactinospora mayteni]
MSPTRPTPEVHGPERCAQADAALSRAFAILGKRWTAPVLGSLRSGPAGFREVSRAVGRVSDSVLSDRLTELAEHGLIVRRVQEGPPIAVSYRLTERGQALMPALEQISRWATEHLPGDDGS